jgi:putative FmdB family regulatory protein
MPCYEYKCPACGWNDEIVKPMSASNTVETCRQCGEVMVRDYAAEGVHCSADSYSREIHSDALAICANQREEHQRLYPDVPLDAADRPVFSNFRQHDEYLAKRGIHKPQGRMKRPSKRIA